MYKHRSRVRTQDFAHSEDPDDSVYWRLTRSLVSSLDRGVEPLVFRLRLDTLPTHWDTEDGSSNLRER